MQLKATSPDLAGWLGELESAQSPTRAQAQFQALKSCDWRMQAQRSMQGGHVVPRHVSAATHGGGDGRGAGRAVLPATPLTRSATAPMASVQDPVGRHVASCRAGLPLHWYRSGSPARGATGGGCPAALPRGRAADAPAGVRWQSYDCCHVRIAAGQNAQISQCTSFAVARSIPACHRIVAVARRHVPPRLPRAAPRAAAHSSSTQVWAVAKAFPQGRRSPPGLQFRR